jgi:hypothetical protein
VWRTGLSRDSADAGKVFKIGEDRSSTPPKMEVYGSFGGLLMLLKVRPASRWRAWCPSELHLRPVPSPTQGEPAGLKDLDVDMRVYLLARKI